VVVDGERGTCGELGVKEALQRLEDKTVGGLSWVGRKTGDVFLQPLGLKI